jgi:hypothetical protein
MPSTFTDSGIELIADGEQSGLWGQTTNTNLQIITRLTSEAGAIALSGTTHTLTVSDGALSDGQYGVLVFGGSPSGTNTVTISPNDAKRIFFVRNSSGQSVVMTQGSGGNVTIANNFGAIVYCTGAGASSQVVDVTSTFNFQPLDADLTAIAALANTDGNFIVGNGSTWVAESGNTAIASLGITATATELNVLDGITASTAELNILDGVTASTAEINILDGVTATAAEINLLDGAVDHNTAAWETGTATDSGLPSPADVKAAIDALASGGLTVDVQTFSANGTWTKPAGAKVVYVEIWGGGGGGGSGRRDVNTAAPSGGGGGGGAAGVFKTFQAADLTSTVSVTIGAGGAGGASVTTNTTNGNIGSDGGDSTFGSYLKGVGGRAGLAGVDGSVSGGSGGGWFDTQVADTQALPYAGRNAVAGVDIVWNGFGGAAGGFSIAFAANNNLAGGDILSPGTGCAGGGGGGTFANTTLNNAGIGGVRFGTNTVAPRSTGVGLGVAGAAGANFGDGGGGGGHGRTAAAGAGGAGNTGAGGGGGGASANGFTSGAGGAGGNGYCRVTTYY